MASYKDWFIIDNPNQLTESQLKEAIKSMANAANKRLKRFEQRGINYGDEKGQNTTAGVRRFTVRGKSLRELKQEFKRVRNFLASPQSSLTGMKKAYKEFKRTINEKVKSNKRSKRLNRAERKEYEKMLKQQKTSGFIREGRRLTQWEQLRNWRDTWKIFNKLVEGGYYARSPADSNQVRDSVYAVVEQSYVMDLNEQETWDRILTNLGYEYEEKQRRYNIETQDMSTSSFFEYGPSD